MVSINAIEDIGARHRATKVADLSSCEALLRAGARGDDASLPRLSVSQKPEFLSGFTRQI